MTGIEFYDWLEYFDLHPYGTDWDDTRMAVLSATICAALTGKTQKPEDHKAKYKRVVKMSPKKINMVLSEIAAEQRQWQARKTSAK